MPDSGCQRLGLYPGEEIAARSVPKKAPIAFRVADHGGKSHIELDENNTSTSQSARSLTAPTGTNLRLLKSPSNANWHVVLICHTMYAQTGRLLGMHTIVISLGCCRVQLLQEL